MKNSMPIVTEHQTRNTCCKFYSTAACLLIRRLSIGGNAFCIFPIDKDDAGRWYFISNICEFCTHLSLVKISV